MNKNIAIDLEERWNYLGSANSKVHCVDERLESLCGKYAWSKEPALLSNPHLDNRCKKCEAKRQRIEANKLKDAALEALSKSIAIDNLIV
jgi:hypothetical protein